MKASLSEYIPRKIMQETILSPRYRSIDKIGCGSFGEIHKVYDIIDKKLRAVKIEKRDRRGAQDMLSREAFIMKLMRDAPHFPRIFEGLQTETESFLTMSFLGANLEMLKKKQNDGKLSDYTILLIAIQMVEALRLLHSKGYLHRDIKPENFVIGTEGNHHCVFIIDFGLSKRFMDVAQVHIPEEHNRGLVGTARYTSINSHKGIEQSRRDDLEALGYVLIYLVRGDLPWQNLVIEKREEKFEAIKNMKIESKIEELTRGLPESLRTFMEHVTKLKFSEEPNYIMIKESFMKDIARIQEELRMSADRIHCLDWCDENCSIRKHLAERIAFSKRKEREASELQQGRRETVFTQSEEFYADTRETINEDLNRSSFEVPLFKTEQSLSLSKYGLGGGGTSSNEQGVQLMSDGDLLEAHSENSSEFNNCSSAEHFSFVHDEHVSAQKVVTSTPTRLAMREGGGAAQDVQQKNVTHF